MKLGVVADADRLADSPDTHRRRRAERRFGRALEGAPLPAGDLADARRATALEATRLVAETIRQRVLLRRVGRHPGLPPEGDRDRQQAARPPGRPAGARSPPTATGRSGSAWRSSAATRCTSRRSVRPRRTSSARRACRPSRTRTASAACRRATLEPDVWRGEISVGDSLVLVSPNVIAKLGADELKDAMLTLHPQSAMEHLHHRFVAADGSGSDGAIAFEATEVASTTRARTLVPVRPAEPLAGAPDRSPIPLADNVQAAGAAVTAAAGSATTRRRRCARAGGRPDPGPHAASQAVVPARDAARLAARDAAPGGARHPRPGHRRRWPRSRRLRLRRQHARSRRSARSTPARRRSTRRRPTWPRSPGPASTSSPTTREQALKLLTHAYDQLAIAQAAKVSPIVISPLRPRSSPGSTGCTASSRSPSTNLFTFKPAGGAAPSTCRRWSSGPTASRTSSIGRPRPSTGSTSRPGPRRSSSGTGRRTRPGPSPCPRYLAVGGQDLLILDDKNTLWRWRPADDTGKGTLTKVVLEGSASLGDDVVGINTFLRPGTRGLYNLYIVDPSEQQIRAYSPAADGGGFPANPTPGWRPRVTSRT